MYVAINNFRQCPDFTFFTVVHPLRCHFIFSAFARFNAAQQIAHHVVAISCFAVAGGFLPNQLIVGVVFKQRLATRLISHSRQIASVVIFILNLSRDIVANHGAFHLAIAVIAVIYYISAMINRCYTPTLRVHNVHCGLFIAIRSHTADSFLKSVINITLHKTVRLRFLHQSVVFVVNIIIISDIITRNVRH